MIAGQSISENPISDTYSDRTLEKVNPLNDYYNGSICMSLGPLSRSFKRPPANNVVNTTESRFNDVLFYEN